MNVNVRNPLVRMLLCSIQHYDHEKYWRMRREVVNPESRVPKVIRYLYLFKIKRMDAYNNASMGTDLGAGAKFDSPPNLVHGLNGILVSHFAQIGEGCVLHQQVTIAQGFTDEAAIIGKNCYIGAGAKIIGKVHIGDNVKIGANAVVVHDLPDNCTAVGVPARVVKLFGKRMDESTVCNDVPTI